MQGRCHPFWSHHSGAMSGALHGARDPLQGGSMVRTHSQTGLGMRLKHSAAKLSILVPPNHCCMLWDNQPANEAIGSLHGIVSFLLALFPGHAHTGTPFYVPSLCITEMLNMSSTLYIASMCSPLWNPMADCRRLSKMCLKTLPQMVVEAHLGSHPD